MALHVLDEANRCLGCKKPLCQQGCPIHTNIPEVIRLLKANQMDAAGQMLFENNPLTTVCSLVCNHENQCEGHCVRNRMPSHDPVHFSIIEDYISTTYANKMTSGPAPRNGMKAAVVGSGPAGLTVAVLLASREIENIFENSDFIYMLNQAQGDRQILAKQLGISPHQLSYVTHSGPGEGLLFFGNVIIPFVDHFPKDTLLYSVLTTRPDEVAGA